MSEDSDFGGKSVDLNLQRDIKEQSEIKSTLDSIIDLDNSKSQPYNNIIDKSFAYGFYSLSIFLAVSYWASTNCVSYILNQFENGRIAKLLNITNNILTKLKAFTVDIIQWASIQLAYQFFPDGPHKNPVTFQMIMKAFKMQLQTREKSSISKENRNLGGKQ